MTMSRELDAYKNRYPQNVYQEEDVPQRKIRIWLSFDINNDPNSAIREAIWNILVPKKVESWGTSVYTYLDDDMGEDNIQNSLVLMLQEAGVLNRPYWQNTPGVSIYVIWRRHYRRENEWYYRSGYFTLIQNADVSHLQKMIDDNINNGNN
ncbi:hypothetical protein IJ556_07630 [bacterium]|nr:hypothetical protein [bacterium]